jgi:dethiobiotin synthetase
VRGPGWPEVVVLVCGTGTEVGKTWVSAGLLRAWRESGRAVGARKPAQSFAPGEGPTDAEVLAAASGEDPGEVCPPERWLAVPMAPPMAAWVLGRPAPGVAELASLAWPAGLEVGLVETAGGVRAPQGHDGDVLDLARLVRPDWVLVVADAGLGTINHVRLTVDALASLDGRSGPVGLRVVLNRFDPGNRLHELNRRWLVERDRLGVRVADGPGLRALAEELACPPVGGSTPGRSDHRGPGSGPATPGD